MPCSEQSKVLNCIAQCSVQCWDAPSKVRAVQNVKSREGQDSRGYTCAVQLHFIQCPFPNQTQFGLGNYLRKIDKYFQTKSGLVWKIIMSNFDGNKFQTKSSLVWEKNVDNCRQQKFQTNSSLVWKCFFNYSKIFKSSEILTEFWL